MESNQHLFVYTLTVRLSGKVTQLGEDHLVLDGRTIVNFANVVSISIVEDDEKPKKISTQTRERF
jgi:hypothetical protein